MTGRPCYALLLLGIRFFSLHRLVVNHLEPVLVVPKVVRKVGACNYVISTLEQRQKTRFCHINFLCSTPEPVDAWLDNSRACEQLQKGLTHLTEAQAQDMLALVAAHPSSVRDRPGLTSLVEHDVDTGGGTALSVTSW